MRQAIIHVFQFSAKHSCTQLPVFRKTRCGKFFFCSSRVKCAARTVLVEASKCTCEVRGPCILGEARVCGGFWVPSGVYRYLEAQKQGYVEGSGYHRWSITHPTPCTQQPTDVLGVWVHLFSSSLAAACAGSYVSVAPDTSSHTAWKGRYC